MIIPMLVCRDAAAELAFCQRAFGSTELSRRVAADGSVVHATLRIHDSLIMVHDESPHLASRAPQPDGSSPVVTYLYGDEVDAVIGRAVSAGARILLPAADQAWGDRVGRIVDRRDTFGTSRPGSGKNDGWELPASIRQHVT